MSQLSAWCPIKSLHFFLYVNSKGPATWDHSNIWAWAAAYEHVRVCGPATVRICINISDTFCHQRPHRCPGYGQQKKMEKALASSNRNTNGQYMDSAGLPSPLNKCSSKTYWNHTFSSQRGKIKKRNKNKCWGEYRKKEQIHKGVENFKR